MYTPRKMVWLACLSIIFASFYFLIPTSFYNNAPLIFSVVGSALFTIFLVQFFFDFKSIDDFNPPDKTKWDSRHKTAPFFVLPGIVMVFVFVMHFHTREEEELKTYGVYAWARVVDGDGFKSRKGSSYSVTLLFYDTKKKKRKVQESIGEFEFNRLSKGGEIMVVYSSKNPELLELITDDVSAKMYYKTEQRQLNLSDMIKLIESGEKERIDRLNEISFPWKKDKKNTDVWYNAIRDEGVAIKPGYVTYLFEELTTNLRDMETEAVEMKFTKVAYPDSLNTLKAEIYENEKYLLQLHNETIKSNEGFMSFQVKKRATLFLR